jgi:Flp pilus assembly protein TadD
MKPYKLLISVLLLALGGNVVEVKAEEEERKLREERQLNLYNAHQAHNEALQFAQDGQERKSLPGFRKATELDPTNPTYFANLGVALMRLNDLDDAQKALKRAQELDPEDQNTIGNIQALQGHLDWREQNKDKVVEKEELWDPYADDEDL